MSATGQAKVYFPQGATGLNLAQGGQIDMTSGSVVMPTGLQGGYVPVSLFDAHTWASGASGGQYSVLTASGANPGLRRQSASADGDPVTQLRWSTAAGATANVILAPIAMPADLSTAGGFTIHIYGEGASANATNQVDVLAYFGIGDTEMGSTVAFTSTPADQTVTLSSANIATSGVLTVILDPDAHASGNITVYGIWGTYTKKTS